MIYILEGPDGAGKTTLANIIAEQRKASVVHSYFDKSWDIKAHHMDMWKAANIINEWRDVVLDRWAPSEAVYGPIFRDKAGYDVMELLWGFDDKNVTWIYCRNDNAVQNHLKNMETRDEMFDDMSQVVVEFDKFINDTDFLNWITYDYDKVDMLEFVKNLPSDRKV